MICDSLTSLSVDGNFDELFTRIFSRVYGFGRRWDEGLSAVADSLPLRVCSSRGVRPASRRAHPGPGMRRW